MDNELREKIAEMDLPLRSKLVLLLAEANTCVPPLTYYEVSNGILALISPELEKARKWDRIVTLSDGDCNTDCPLFNNNHDKHTSLCALKPNNIYCLFTDVIVLLDDKEVKDEDK